MAEIRVGTSSWADRLLLASGWYPRSVNTPAGRLAHYADRFDLVEVDTSYYALPTVETTAAWAHPAVVRFHGHSPDWADGDKQDKFRYAYSDDELRDWAGQLDELADQTSAVHVLMNNCCGDQAQRDAARLAELLDDPTSATVASGRRPSGRSRQEPRGTSRRTSSGSSGRIQPGIRG